MFFDQQLGTEEAQRAAKGNSYLSTSRPPQLLTSERDWIAITRMNH